MTGRVWPAIVLTTAVLLGPASAARAQFTADEVKQLDDLLKEPDSKASIAKRLALFAHALDREADPKRRLSSSYGPTFRRARIPAADGVPFLIARLDDPTEVGKRGAMSRLAEYEGEARAAVPKLRQLMDDAERNVRADAMMTLAKIDPGNRAIAEAIVARLGATDDNHTNRSILEALVRMAAVVPKTEVPRIARFRDHPWSQVGLLAFEAAGRVLDLRRPSLDEIRVMNTLEWRNLPDHGYAVLTAVQDAGPKATFAVPLLVELLVSDPPMYLKCAALQTLGKVQVSRPRLISALLDGLASPDLFYRHMAHTALRAVDLTRPEAVRAMAKGLRHADAKVRTVAALCLWSANNRPSAAKVSLAGAVPDLVATLKEVNEDVTPGLLHAYLQVVRFAGRDAAPAAEPLLAIYANDGYFQKHRTNYVKLERGLLLAILADIGVPKSARPVLLAALKKDPKDDFEPGYTFAAAARALGKLGPDAKDAVPLLLPALAVTGNERVYMWIDWDAPGSPPTTARLEAVRALGRIGPAARDALPRLREMADGKGPPAPPELGPRLRHEARRAVAAIEGGTTKK
jgi:hypothetical protein